MEVRREGSGILACRAESTRKIMGGGRGTGRGASMGSTAVVLLFVYSK